ncbi:unnamed protein product [Rotaria socialis]
MYVVPSYAPNTTQNNARDSFRRDLESIRRDLNDLRNSTNSTSCLVCSRRAITSRIKPTTCPHYHSAYDQRFVKPTKPHLVPNYIFHTLPETKSSWESSWAKNENYHFMEPKKSSIVPNYIARTLPETKSSWESSWTKNENYRFMEPTKSSIVPNYIVRTQPETRSSWESSWTKNDNHYNYPQRPWTISRYVP